jgi:hypothetical protein
MSDHSLILLGTTNRRQKLPRLWAITLSQSRASYQRKRWQLSRVTFNCLFPFLDSLLRSTPLAVEAHQCPAVHFQVGHDEPLTLTAGLAENRGRVLGVCSANVFEARADGLDI